MAMAPISATSVIVLHLTMVFMAQHTLSLLPAVSAMIWQRLDVN